MTNYKHYKGNPDELRKAFLKHCDQFKYPCTGCKYSEKGVKRAACVFAFVCAEHEEAKPPVKKRRPYTFEEAKGLLGKRLEYSNDLDCKFCEVVNQITLGFDQDDINAVDINSEYQDNLLKWGATIDGEPFGVEAE